MAGIADRLTYFRWFESGRMDYLREVGYLGHMAATRQGPILAHTECRFRAPLAWPERVAVETGVDDVGADRFLMRYRVTALSSGVVAAEGSGRMVGFDYAVGGKCPLPPAVRAAILEIESQEVS